MKEHLDLDLNLNIRQIIKIWINETLQAFVIISVIHFLKPTVEFKIQQVAKYAFYMGIVFTILKIYNQDIYDKAEGGMFYTLGNSFMG